ncbi:MAG: polymer-forming cytoskeletal protein [Proteobacteria bacterium]|nr:polymer-forming cytoskeletal protein [Pseudomonadota bacterium]
MAFFKRRKGKKKSGSSSSSRSSPEDARAKSSVSHSESESPEPRETSPERVGIVLGILMTTPTKGQIPMSEIVDRHFGLDAKKRNLDADSRNGHSSEKRTELPPQHEHLRAVEPLLEDVLDSPNLEVDPMVHAGHATTITGNILAQEDLEIQGTIEGSIRLANHQLTVGADGLVKATVEAHTVLVLERITGDVIASERVEIEAGGVIGGDVKMPRVIMHDGGVVVGGIDMSASLSSIRESSKSQPVMPEHPKLKSVEPTRDSSTEEGGA